MRILTVVSINRVTTLVSILRPTRERTHPEAQLSRTRLTCEYRPIAEDKYPFLPAGNLSRLKISCP